MLLAPVVMAMAMNVVIWKQHPSRTLARKQQQQHQRYYPRGSVTRKARSAISFRTKDVSTSVSCKLVLFLDGNTSSEMLEDPTENPSDGCHEASHTGSTATGGEIVAPEWSLDALVVDGLHMDQSKMTGRQARTALSTGSLS